MKKHDNITRNLFNKIHLKQIHTSGFQRMKNILNEKNLKLKKDFFKNKVCADLGCGSTGVGALNLLNLGAKEVHLMDMKKHIIRPINKNLKKYKGRYKIYIDSLENLPFKKNKFDFVLCQGVIHHMDNDNKGFKEIHRVIKKNGFAHISVQGDGGIIPEFMYKILIPNYKKNKLVKKILDEIMNKKSKQYLNYYLKNLDPNGRRIVKFLSKYFDEDFLLTMKDRILSPNYYQYEQKKLVSKLKKIGFKNIYRIKKKVAFNNIRTLVAPFYHHYDHDLSRFLYGDGDIGLVLKKK